MLFNVLVENRHELSELPIPEEKKEHDECIMSARCEGGCENVSQLKRLNSLKQLGNNRSCPQSKSQDKKCINVRSVTSSLKILFSLQVI